jgi:hypothetical protein
MSRETREVAMHVNRRLLGWGVFFIALGLVPLAVQGGMLDAATARQAWQLWPMLLVGIGLALVLRHTPLVALGNLVVGLTFGLMAGGVVGGGFAPGAPFAVCGVGGSTATGPNGPPTTGTLGSNASVSLAVDCGALTVSTATGSDWSIAWPSVGVSAPDIGSGSDHLDASFGRRHGFGVGEPAARWDVVLPEDPSIALSVDVGAGSLRASLASARVASLVANVNAGDAHIDLTGSRGATSASGSVNAGSLRVALPAPDTGLTGTFSANAGSIAMCTPSGVPLRITVDDNTLGSTNFAQRAMAQNGNVWTRGPFSPGTPSIDLHISVNVGSITLDPEDGCG